MRRNYTQTGVKGTGGRIYLEDDWYDHGLPPNASLATGVYVDTSYGFAQFHSVQPDALRIGEGSGCYDRTSIIVGEKGKISVGKYCILNGTTIVCKNEVAIGDHCMLAWGSVLTDSWMDAPLYPVAQRKKLLKAAAEDPQRRHPFFGEASPVVLEENCWVGFGAVILPGVRLGRGCVVACKTIVDFDVPPYAIVSGNPAKIIRWLQPDDTAEEKQKALLEYSR